MQISRETLELIDKALREDQASADVTTEALIPPQLRRKSLIVAKVPGILAGIEVAQAVFRQVDPYLETHIFLADGTSVNPGDAVARIYGAVSSILRAERVALNFLQRMSGIATETSRYVKAVQDLNVRILDTRKTVPGLRHLDKYAVHVGGGHNHRLDLASGILIKDNHIAALANQNLSLSEMVWRARTNAPHTLKVEVEVSTVPQAQEALKAGAELLLLDNMTLEQMGQVVAMSQGQAITEASGGIALETVRAVAETGVDLISVGALTHSVRALDLSLEVQPATSGGG